MFLNNSSGVLIDALEKNSVLVNLLWGVVGVVVSSLFWGFRYRRETRAAATFGFYSHFLRLLTEYQRLFDLCVKNDKNPYTLIYVSDVLDANRETLKVPFGSTADCIEKFRTVSEATQKALSETTNNVYPSWTRKKRWYREQQIVYKFTQFIVDGIERNHATELTDEHTEKWEELQKAVRYLSKKMNKAIY